MTEAQRSLVLLASDLLEYPEREFWQSLIHVERGLADRQQGHERLHAAVKSLAQKDFLAAREDYVAIFDHNPDTSLYMAWHRYGNDRGQGRAMAALNGLYRASGFEPAKGTMPDYLPRMLEFMAVAEDWAIEVMLDGFGTELAALVKHLKEMDSEYAVILETALAPFAVKWPGYFKPRGKLDPTRRPMARPEPEFPLPGLQRRVQNQKKD